MCNPVIGIDLGTTYCCVGYYRTAENRVEIIKNEVGERTTPSYVLFSETGTVIGKFVKEKVNLISENVVYDSKRLIGQNFDSTNVQKSINSWSFRVARGVNNKPLIKVTIDGGFSNYEPEQISAKLLEYMKRMAEDKLDTKIKHAVITVPQASAYIFQEWARRWAREILGGPGPPRPTCSYVPAVPAYFNYHQRAATERAGNLAGLNVLRIINEPTAAALAYVHNNQLHGFKNLLIFDLGGGTFDVSIVTVQSNKSVTVRATSGNTYLGGRDFDDNLSNFIATELERAYKVSIKTDEDTMRRIRSRSEKTKIDLSQTTKTNYDIVGLIPRRTDINFEIKRTDFERIYQGLFQQCMNIVNNCLVDVKMRATDVDKVVLCGGSSRIPKLQDMLIKQFGERKLSKSLDPDEAVAYGAALQAATLEEDDKKALVPKIYDITPLSLGTGTLGNQMTFIIKRNSSIPITKSSSFRTIHDKQSSLKFDIYEGERTMVQHNTKIGSCTLTNLPPRPPGYPVELSFHINENGVLEVEAKSEHGIYTNLVIQYETQDIVAIVDVLREAKIHETKDKITSEVVGKWKALHEYSIRVKTICTYDNRKINREEKDTILSIADDTIKWLDKNKVKNGSPNERDEIVRKHNKIENICQPILREYSYHNIHSMPISKFYEFILNLQKNV